MYKALSFGLLVAVAACATVEGDTGDEKRANIDAMAKKTLVELYESKPETKAEVANAPGYAVFSNFGTKIFLIGSGSGYGVVVPKSGKRTYMKMAELGVGLGVGVKKFRGVFVFQSESVMNKFVNEGWEFASQADASAESGDTGGSSTATATADDVKVYELTDTGVALSATVGGTKYWKYDELN